MTLAQEIFNNIDRENAINTKINEITTRIQERQRSIADLEAKPNCSTFLLDRLLRYFNLNTSLILLIDILLIYHTSF